MNQSLVQIIIAVGSSAGLTTLIAAIFNRNKSKAEQEQISAEATQIITNAAKGLVNDYREDNALLRQKLGETEQKLASATSQLESTTRALREAVSALRETGADVSRLIQQNRDLFQAPDDVSGL
jgi:hypothetical protein